MKIALLQADHVSEHRHCVSGGNYPQMFANLFLKTQTIIDINVYDVTSGHYPQALECYDGFIITGSRATTFERQNWIQILEGKIQHIHQARKKLIGICFGHQITAQALGGKVERSGKGWGIGIQYIEILKAKAWMRPYQNHLSLAFYHQDQVVELPPGAQLIATNQFAPVQMFTLENHIWGMQAHPEMLRAHNHLLMQEQKSTLHQQFIHGIDSLRVRDHGQLVGHWMVKFFEKE